VNIKIRTGVSQCLKNEKKGRASDKKKGLETLRNAQGRKRGIASAPRASIEEGTPGRKHKGEVVGKTGRSKNGDLKIRPGGRCEE